MHNVMNDQMIDHLIAKEKIRQQEEICLIASENYVSADVMAAQGSCLTNKYAEGYPAKRYYGGCEVVDQIESIAISRAKKLFNCGYANVQPHSGSQANAAVFSALAEAGDTILGMKLSDGGHLTHGSPVNFSGKNYKFYSYGVNSEGLIDYDEVQRIAKGCKPKIIIAGYSAYSRTLDFDRFREIADEVGAYLVVDMAHFAGFVAANVMTSPLLAADVVTSTTHKTLRGPRGGLILSNNPKLYKKLDSAVFPRNQGGPLMHVIAAKAVCFKEAMSHDYRCYMFDVRANASMAAEIFKERGFKVVSDGTDNHMFLVDFSDKDYTGGDVEEWLGRAGIIVNKNTVPNEKNSPQDPSGIRIGLAALTTRGFTEYEIDVVMRAICAIIESKGDENCVNEVKAELSGMAIVKPTQPVISE